MLEPGLGRALDANRNRCLEALRVLEDWARFARNDGPSASRGKSLRHELISAFQSAGIEDLSIYRDSLGDLGHPDHAVLGATLRRDSNDVLRANASRAKESIRVLEELARTIDPKLAARLERLRYEIYDFEKSILSPRQRLRERLAAEPLCLLLGPGPSRPALTEQMRIAHNAGCGFFQARIKQGSDKALLFDLQKLADLASELEVLLVINDRADLAHATRCGVHLGQDDLPSILARKILGDQGLIGVSIHSASELASSLNEEVDYLGIGTIFSSSTKPELGSAGPDLLRALAPQCPRPIFAIGGITAANAAQAIGAGASGVAVSAAILDSADPGAATQAIVAAVQSARKNA